MKEKINITLEELVLQFSPTGKKLTETGKRIEHRARVFLEMYHSKGYSSTKGKTVEGIGFKFPDRNRYFNIKFPVPVEGMPESVVKKIRKDPFCKGIVATLLKEPYFLHWWEGLQFAKTFPMTEERLIKVLPGLGKEFFDKYQLIDGLEVHPEPLRKFTKKEAQSFSKELGTLDYSQEESGFKYSENFYFHKLINLSNRIELLSTPFKDYKLTEMAMSFYILWAEKFGRMESGETTKTIVLKQYSEELEITVRVPETAKEEDIESFRDCQEVADIFTKYSVPLDALKECLRQRALYYKNFNDYACCRTEEHQDLQDFVPSPERRVFNSGEKPNPFHLYELSFKDIYVNL